MIHIGDQRRAYNILIGYAERKSHLKDAGVDVSANGVFRNRKYRAFHNVLHDYKHL
jgi:hypothetical protein